MDTTGLDVHHEQQIERNQSTFSWFEQKAVVVLLTLLHLGVQGIRLGPVAPAFITPNVFKILQDKFDLKIIESHPPKELFELTAV